MEVGENWVSFISGVLSCLLHIWHCSDIIYNSLSQASCLCTPCIRENLWLVLVAGLVLILFYHDHDGLFSLLLFFSIAPSGMGVGLNLECVFRIRCSLVNSLSLHMEILLLLPYNKWSRNWKTMVIDDITWSLLRCLH